MVVPSTAAHASTVSFALAAANVTVDAPPPLVVVAARFASTTHKKLQPS